MMILQKGLTTAHILCEHMSKVWLLHLYSSDISLEKQCSDKENRRLYGRKEWETGKD